MMNKTLVLVFAASLLLTTSGAYADLPTGPVPGKFIVKLSEQADPVRLSSSLAKGSRLTKLTGARAEHARIGSDVWDRYYVLYDPAGSLSAADMVVMLGKENIEHIEPDYFLELFDWPSDALFSNQWYLNNTGQSYLGIVRLSGSGNDYQTLKSGVPGKDVRLQQMYETPPAESTRVVVAIVDTGVDPTHPELSGRFWKNTDDIPGNGIDDDHNGFVDDTIGYDVSGDVPDFFNPQGDNDPTDVNGHGTHIAGIVAANANGVGVVGICPWAQIMAVKMMPNGTSAVGAAGIVYAVNSGAQVINISWGSPFESGVLRDALMYAESNGVLVCIAPGNSGDNSRFFPAAFDSVLTVIVAAGGSDGYQTSWSTYGAHVDIVAPGLDILSLRASGTDMYSQAGEPLVRIVDHLYYLADGTSMATPMVVGAAALILSFRPDLSLAELEDVLLRGATDLIDPRHMGDSLPGPDTISGYGYLNIDSSLSLLERGGLHIVQPERGSRHTTDFQIRIAAIAGYTGSWQLHYSLKSDPEDWHLIATGSTVPADSVAAVFSDPTVEGHINLRLTDKYGSTQTTSVVHTRQNTVDITYPHSGDELNYSTPIRGSVHGPDFDSMAIFSWQARTSQRSQIFHTTSEFFDSLIAAWSVSGSDTGDYVISLVGYFASDSMVDTVSVRIASAFAAGWPQPLGDRCALTPICCDLNRDGLREVAVGTRRGLLLFHGHSGQVVDNFPVLPGVDMRSVPAVYDIDRDGEDEIICTSDTTIHAFNYDGTYADGWPQYTATGMIPYEYAFPNPVVTQLRLPTLGDRGIPDSAIIFINKAGDIMAYRFNGESYSFKQGGHFADMDPRLADFVGVGGGSSPFVTALDLGEPDTCGELLSADSCETTFEVVASYTSPAPYTGLGIFKGANGQPRFDEDDPVVERLNYVYGTVLADLNGDLLPDIIAAGYAADGSPGIWAKSLGTEDVPGWPAKMPDVTSWISSYPTAADLDLDGAPEILITFFEYDRSALYVFRSDGTPYVERDPMPPGQAFAARVTFGTPVVADLTGDRHPEIIFRAGYLLPGTGPERVYVLDYGAELVPGWPVATPARAGRVFSSRYAPLVDDVDADGLVELVLISDGDELLVWDFDASVDNGRNTGRFLMNNQNTGILPPRVPTAIDDDPTLPLPDAVALHQNFPNPFNPETKIRFDLASRSSVLLEVYNILGQKVTTLIDREMTPGRHEVEFDGTGLATGTYFYRLKIGDTVETRKMLMIK